MAVVRRPAATAGSAGMVTAETVVVLPFLLLVAATLLWVVSLGVTQVRVADAAREAARVVARGQPDTAARSEVRRLLPGARARIRHRDGRVEVQVSRRSAFALVPQLRFDHRSTSVAAVE